MQVQSITANQNNYKIRFRGTVSPEFVQYVNELRQDCLETATKSSAEKINKACDRILKTSTEVMEKCFHPLSVLTINYDEHQKCDAIQVKSIIAKHCDGSIPSAGFVPQKGKYSSDDRFDILSYFINSGFAFAEAAIKELTFTSALIMMLEDYNGNKEELFDSVSETLNWWKEHLSILPEDTTQSHNNIAVVRDIRLPELIQELENLKNTSEKTAKE